MRYRVYDVDFDGMTPYGVLVPNYYGEEGVIYNGDGNVVEDEELEMRNLYIEYKEVI